MFFPGRYMLRIYLLEKMGDDGKFHRESDSSKPPPTRTLDSRGSIFSKLRIKSWSFSRLCMAGDWRNMENSQQKIASKKVDHEGPTTKKKCGKFGSYPFKVDINLFFSSSGQRNLLQTMRCPPASVEEYQDFAKHVS